MSYTKRTCSRCGYRDIQPNMKQVTESYTSGHSQRQISKRSIIGAFLGDPRAKRQNADWLLGNTRENTPEIGQFGSARIARIQVLRKRLN